MSFIFLLQIPSTFPSSLLTIHYSPFTTHRPRILPLLPSILPKPLFIGLFLQAGFFYEFYPLMKRVLLHISFWLLYLVQDALMMFVWMEVAVPELKGNEAVLKAVYTSVIVLIPKLILTYFILYFAVKRILNRTASIAWVTVSIVVLLFVCLVMYRVIFNYYVYPVIYTGAVKIYPLLELRRVLQALVDVGFVTGGAVALKLLRIQLAGKEREKNLIKEKLETELKFLRNQTNPHFLFNTLNNIYALARKKSDDTPETVMKLSKLLRFMLYESRNPFIKIGDEIKMLDDYIELEKIRYNGRLTINFIREVDDDTGQISPMLLLPFVENAFKHGASESRFESYIHIDMRLKNCLLHFNVENTKESSDNSSVTENIGLSNVKRQLELMYSDYDMQVKNETSLFKISLTINLQSHAKI
jgi:sensor histidine kinase YesM